MNPRNFDVYLGMSTDTLHNLLGRRFLEVYGLAISLHDRIPWRFHGCGKTKHVLVKRNGFFHIGGRQHGADSFCYRCACHREASNRLILSAVETRPAHRLFMPRPLRIFLRRNDLAVSHVNDAVAVSRSRRVVRDHEHGLAQLAVGSAAACPAQSRSSWYPDCRWARRPARWRAC